MSTFLSNEELKKQEIRKALLYLLQNQQHMTKTEKDILFSLTRNYNKTYDEYIFQKGLD